MNDFLKGNFKVKKPVVVDEKEEKENAAQTLMETVRKKALSSLGGSMVYVERTDLAWDGEDDSENDKS